MLRRWKVITTSLGLGLLIRRLRKEQTAALAQVGRLYRTSSLEPGSVGSEPAPSDAVAQALASVAELEERLRVLSERLAGSLEADRRDFRATGSALGRGLIVVRGVLDRLVLRDEAGCARRALPERQIELGRRLLADPAALERVEPSDRQRLLEASAARARAEAERTELLAPFGNDPLPAWMRGAWDETRTFGRLLKDELTKKVYLRVPALAAMAVAWWITQRYTDSRFETNLNHFTGEGRAGLSSGEFELLTFWLPLVVSALVAHALAALTRRIRRRYAGESLA
jgi:hypothetical protein